MNRYKQCLLISLFSLGLIHTPGFAQQPGRCESQQSTVELNQCLHQELQRKDKALNEAYQTLLKSLAPADKSDTRDFAEVKKRLIAAQRAWIAYRDSDCDAKYKLWEEGTIRGTIQLVCLAERTEQRTKELRSWNNR